MKRQLLFILIVFASCHQSDIATQTGDSTVTVSNDTIPEIRKSVKSAPVAEYSEPIKDELNNWKFAVAAFETEKTFHYTIRMQAKEVRITDSITIPNFGIQPKVAIRKGKEPFTCIIGFLDKKNEFKEYRKVSFAKEQLHIKTIASYYVGSYRTPAK